MNHRFVIGGYNTPLSPESTSIPQPGAGELIVRNAAIGLNPSDWKMIAGHFAAAMPVEFPFVPGTSSAGTVESVGTAVSRFKVGDQVIAHRFGGAFQQVRAVEESAVVPKPRGVPFEIAAAIPAASTTGWALVHQLDICSEDTLLVHGAAGAVGSAAVQVAVARGARVLGTASPHNHGYLRELGAIPLEHGPGLASRLPRGLEISAVADAFGGADNVAATLVARGGAERTATAVADEHSAAAGIPPVGRYPEALAVATQLVAARVIRIRIAATRALEDVEGALSELRTGGSRGRIVLTVPELPESD